MNEATCPVSVIGPHVIEELVRHAAGTSDGCFVEVGVYKGGSAWHLAKKAEEQGRDILLFDTFTGIPFKGELDSHAVADFNDTSREAVAAAIPYAEVFKGIFPAMNGLDEIFRDRQVAFAHIDCDQYQSVRETALFLAPRMAKGAIMWFDDYYCLAGATKAVDELFAGRIEIVETGSKAIVRF